VVFAARANQASFQWPLSSITYDTVTTGAYTDISDSLTLLFGSTAGASDLGISRIRLAPTSTVLSFGLSSQGTRLGEVNPVDNCYLTVINERRIFSKPPYIADDGTVYLDGDVAYVDQNDEPAPCSNCGPPFAATIDPTSSKITVTLDGTTSFATAPGATITDYLWDLGAGATITVGSTSTSTVTVQYTAGFRYARLQVTDSLGSTHNSYVPILAINPAADPTVDAFQITRHTIKPDGQELELRLLENVSVGSWPDGGLLIIMEKEPTGPTDRSNILFWGWGDTEEAEIDSEQTGVLKDTTIRCLDVAARLRQLPGYSQVLTHKPTPTQWAEVNEPTLDFMIYWLLYYQSTALAVADFTWSGTSTAYSFPELIADGSNLWDQVDRKAQTMLPDRRLVCNRRGQIAVESDPLIMEVASRPLTTQAHLAPEFYQSIRFTQQTRPTVSRLRAGAILASNTIVEGLQAIAPGPTPSQGEREISSQENIAASQNALNAAIGHRYARLNAPQGLFTVTMVDSDNSAYDPARMDWVELTIDAAQAAQRGLTFTQARCLLHQLDVRYQYGPGGTVRTNTLRLERETVGIPAVTVVPEVADPPDVDDYIPPPYVPDPAFDNGLPVDQNVVGTIDRRGYIWTCTDFTTATPPTWSRNTSASAAASFSTGSLLSFVIDPFSPGYRGLGSAINGFAVSTTDIYRVTDLFGTPAFTSLHTLAISATSASEMATIACSFGRYEAVEADNPWLICAYHVATGSNPLRTYVVYSRDGGATWSSAIDVSTFTRTAIQEEISRPAVWMSPRTPGLAYVGAWTATGADPDGGLYVTTDWGATWSAATAIDDGGIGMGIGFSMHVPWTDNADEAIAYYGGFDRTSNIFNYSLWRSVAGTATGISPVDGGDTYGPARGLFSVRTLDTDRQHVLLAGVTDDVDDIPVGVSGSDAYSAIWKSSDAGATWTRVTSDVLATGANDAVMQVAFSADSENHFYAWGLSGTLLYTEDGSTMLDKSPVSPISSGLEFLAIFGGS
jgi:hypothetical protein